MLYGDRAKNGYDWWWNSFLARHSATGELKPFFIEYFIINPALSPNKVVFGQLEENKLNKNYPSYCMMKVGTWGNEKAQLHEFFPSNEFVNKSNKKLDLKIAHNSISENHLKGSVNVSAEDSMNYPERMTDFGSLEWDLKVENCISYDVGIGSSFLMRKMSAFEMFWHVHGLYAKFSGKIIFNNQEYIVDEDSSFGYRDKNWGVDYTIPWLWLNCNNFVSRNTGLPEKAFLDVGGGCPVFFGINLNRRIITAFYYKNEKIEVNFSKFWLLSKQLFECTIDDEFVKWNITSVNRKYKLEIRFKCLKSNMIKVNYENPKGLKYYQNLWNGGHAYGSVEIFKKNKGDWTLLDILDGQFGGCEYGEN